MNKKNQQELNIMIEGGRKLHDILDRLIKESKPGVSLIDIENTALKMIDETGGTPSFMTVEGYKWATCLCLNDEVVHGIPRKIRLKEGDIFTVDVGLLYKGFHTDTARSVIVTDFSDYKKRYHYLNDFLTVGVDTLANAINVVKPGNRIGHISQAIEQNIVSHGFSIIKSLVGHGVGKSLHEEIQIPGFLKGNIEDTPELEAGMTIAIEVIYAEGKGSVVYANNDGWTISTKDRSLSAVYEHTIAVTKDGFRILT